LQYGGAVGSLASPSVNSVAQLPPGSGMDPSRMPALSSAWSKVAIAFLGHVGPSLARAQSEDPELQVIPLLRQTLLNVRVPTLLAGAERGPHWARLVIEKLVSTLTNGVNSGAPLAVVREAVALVAKFFLQNLHTLQRHQQFGQLWLMVLRLMLLFEKRGKDDRDAELEEIARETLKNLLQVLLSMKVLGFVAKKGSGSAAEPTGDTPVWWQMTWDCIEVFLPGFGDEFSKSTVPEKRIQAPEPPAVLADAPDPAPLREAAAPAEADEGTVQPPTAPDAAPEAAATEAEEGAEQPAVAADAAPEGGAEREDGEPPAS